MAKAQRISLEDALADFIDDLRAANRTDNTIAFYLDKLRPFFTWLRDSCCRHSPRRYRSHPARRFHPSQAGSHRLWR